MAFVDKKGACSRVFSMNNVTPEKKEGLIKTLAIFGFIGLILSIAWLSVQLVKVFPSAVASLASLADSVYHYDPDKLKEIELGEVSKEIVAGDTLDLNWKKEDKSGSYTIRFECDEEINIAVRSAESDFADIECGKTYNLGSVDQASLTLASEVTEPVSVNYTLAYFRTNSQKESAAVSDTLTLNPKVAIEVPEEEVTVNERPITPKPNTGSGSEEPAPTTPTRPTPTPVYEYTYTYELPKSDPKGSTDLSVSYLGIGQISSTNTFLNTGALKQNVPGAIQFVVHNIGTKTSEDWFFTAKLPGGITYESTKQTALKPNEKATLTFNFPAIDELELQKFSFSVETKDDKNTKNNQINWSTVVIK
jgi:hypothetical protein